MTDVQENKVGLSAEHVTLQEQTLTDEQEESTGLTVTGLALPFGEKSRNGVMYEEESVREAADSMIGTAVLFNHDQHEVVGHVEDVEVHDEGLSYRMDLNPEHELVDAVERGDISNVSIQALVDPVEGDTSKVEVKEFLELSLVTIPGFKQTDVQVEEVGSVPEGVMTVESFVNDDTISSKSENQVKNILGELSMEKIKEQLSADEVDSLMELINIHNEALKEDIREYMEQNDLIEDEEEPEEPEDDEEPEEEKDDEEDGEEEEAQGESVEEESEEESVEDESEEEDGSEEESTEGDDEVEESEEESEDEEEESDEEESEESVEDEPVDPVAEEMTDASESADFKATVPSISH